MGSTVFFQDLTLKPNLSSSLDHLLDYPVPCGALVNQYYACADCLFVDVPSSANIMLQALHRLFRLGQRLTSKWSS